MFQILNPNKINAIAMLVQIQFCRNCSLHSWCSRHDENKYLDYFEQTRTRLLHQLQHVKVIQRRAPEQLVLSRSPANDGALYVNVVTGKSVHFPGLGSFEVFVEGVRVFSKIKCKMWPKISQVVEKIRNMQQEYERGGQLEKFDVDYEPNPEKIITNRELYDVKAIFRIRNPVPKMQENNTFRKSVQSSNTIKHKQMYRSLDKRQKGKAPEQLEPLSAKTSIMRRPNPINKNMEVNYFKITDEAPVTQSLVFNKDYATFEEVSPTLSHRPKRRLLLNEITREKLIIENQKGEKITYRKETNRDAMKNNADIPDVGSTNANRKKLEPLPNKIKQQEIIRVSEDVTTKNHNELPKVLQIPSLNSKPVQIEVSQNGKKVEQKSQLKQTTETKLPIVVTSELPKPPQQKKQEIQPIKQIEFPEQLNQSIASQQESAQSKQKLKVQNISDHIQSSRGQIQQSNLKSQLGIPEKGIQQPEQVQQMQLSQQDVNNHANPVKSHRSASENDNQQKVKQNIEESVHQSLQDETPKIPNIEALQSGNQAIMEENSLKQLNSQQHKAKAVNQPKQQEKPQVELNAQLETKQEAVSKIKTQNHPGPIQEDREQPKQTQKQQKQSEAKQNISKKGQISTAKQVKQLKSSDLAEQISVYQLIAWNTRLVGEQFMLYGKSQISIAKEEKMINQPVQKPEKDLKHINPELQFNPAYQTIEWTAQFNKQTFSLSPSQPSPNKSQNEPE